MSRTRINTVARLAAGLLASAAAFAARGGTVQFQLGEQDFADGKTPVYSREIRAAGAGEMFPFDGTVFGNDLKSNQLGAFDYVHAFDFGGATPVSATLTVGLIDVDSAPDAPLETVSLTLDGFGQPTDLLAGVSALGAKSSVEVVDIPVPVEMLSDGVLHVAFSAVLPGYGNAGNAIEPDFSRLVVEIESRRGNDGGGTIDPAPLPPPIVDPDGGPRPIPLPPALVPAAVLIAGIALAPKRRLRRWLRV